MVSNAVTNWSMLAILQEQNYSTVSALVVLIWDYLVTVQCEFKYVWKPSGTCPEIRTAFVFVRYYAIASQLVNTVLIQTYGVSPDTDLHACRARHVVHSISFWLVYFGCDAVLMLRAFVSCNRLKKIGIWLLFHLAIEIAAAVICTHQLAKTWFSEATCHGTHIPPTVIMGGLVIFFSQSILLAFGVVKRKLDKKSHRSVPYVEALFCDQGWPLVFYLCTALLLVPFVFLHKLAQPHILFTWPITIFSVTGSRTVISITKAIRKRCPDELPFSCDQPGSLPDTDCSTHHSISPEVAQLPSDVSAHIRSSSTHNSFALGEHKSSILFASNPSVNKPPSSEIIELPRNLRPPPSISSYDSRSSHRFDDQGLHRMPSLDLERDSLHKPFNFLGISNGKPTHSRDTMDS